MNLRSSFTLIELLVVLAIVAILSVVVITTLNPIEFLRQARDSNRLSDLGTINTALGVFNADVSNGFMGSSSVVYVSVPDSSSACANLGLPALPSGWSYNCVTATSTRNTDGTGWVPVNFKQISFGSPLSLLPIDPINTTTTGDYYTYVSGGSWILTALPESQKQKTLYTNNPTIPNYPGVIGVGSNLSLSPLYNPSGLVGYWKFDEGSGTVAKDSSGNGNDGTWGGNGLHYVVGKVGNYASQFNGSDDSITVANASSLNFGTSGFSVSVWIRKGAATGQRGISSKNFDTANPGWILYQHVSNGLTWLISDGLGGQNNIFVAPINDNIWHHVIGVTDRNSNKLYIYVDGVLAQTGTITITGSVSSSYGLDMGSRWGYLDGSVDDVRIYNRVLSAAEVLALYNATR